jgi:hypothetical protein
LWKCEKLKLSDFSKTEEAQLATNLTIGRKVLSSYFWK